MLDAVDDGIGLIRQLLVVDCQGHIPIPGQSKEVLTAQQWVRVDGLAVRPGGGPDLHDPCTRVAPVQHAVLIGRG
eukprot:4114350-Lingulodinium_polyedra.AAC.1